MNDATRQDQQSAITRAWERVRLDVSRAVERTQEFLMGSGREYREFSRRAYQEERTALRQTAVQPSVPAMKPVKAAEAVSAVPYWQGVAAQATTQGELFAAQVKRSTLAAKS
jgi:hypothetical protein